MMTPSEKEIYKNVLNKLARELHETSKEKGFWEKEINIGEKLMLVVSELGEALEAVRHGNPPDKHLPSIPNLNVEIADAIIRLLDLSEGLKIDIGEAIVEKMAFNKKREHKHGKEF